MISFFGIISVVVFTASVAAMVLHFNVMKRRAALDNALAQLDDLLRERLELLYETESNEIRKQCEAAAALETRELLRHFPAPYNDETANATEALNTAIETYNVYIATFPAKQMAAVLGLAQEKKVH